MDGREGVLAVLGEDVHRHDHEATVEWQRFVLEGTFWDTGGECRRRCSAALLRLVVDDCLCLARLVPSGPSPRFGTLGDFQFMFEGGHLGRGGLFYRTALIVSGGDRRHLCLVVRLSAVPLSLWASSASSCLQARREDCYF